MVPPMKTLKQSTLDSRTVKLAATQLMQQAVEYHQAGNLLDAEKLYLQVLQKEPGCSDALHLLGVLARQNNHYNEAIVLIQSAIGIKDTDPNYHCNLGAAFRYRGNLAESVLCYQRALTLNPEFVEAHNNLGEALTTQGEYSEAEACYQRVLALNPDFALAHYNLGNTSRMNGDPETAISFYQRALELDPSHTLSHYHLGLTLQSMDRLNEAKEGYRHALDLDPEHVLTLLDLGNLLRIERDYDAAIAYFKQVLNNDPAHATAHYNLGIALYDCGRFTDAVAGFERSLEYNSGFQDAHNYLGLIAKDRGNTGDALTHFKNAIAINPSDAMIHSNLLLYLNYAPGFSRAEVYHEHQRYNALHAAALTTQSSYSNSKHPQRRLRIGYVSPDFRKHANAYFFEPVLEHHDRAQFEIYCYYTDTKVDMDNQRIQQHSDHWLDCAKLSDDILVDQIKRDQIDLLVDLAGHTANNRLGIFARKPAPVQLAYLGYPNTRGMPCIDYRISDRHIEPENDAENFSTETLIRMPESWYCFRPPNDSPAVNALPAASNGYITFGSLNQHCKTNPGVLTLWAQVLQAVPGSKLLIHTHTRSLNDPNTRQTFAAFFNGLGISADRLIFDDLEPPENHLCSYHKIDIGLDTFPHNGGATTCEALWMGVPVVTLPGESLASRMSLSILSTLNMLELVARTENEYVAICAKLAVDKQGLQHWRTEMRNRMQASPLLDPATFTRQLEAAYQKMWQAWCGES